MTTRELSEERRELLDELVRTHTTIGTMKRTYGFNEKTVRKYYPDYRRKVNGLVPLDDETRAIVERNLEDRPPASELARMAGISIPALVRRYPDTPWTKSEAGHLGQIMSQFRQTTKRGIR